MKNKKNAPLLTIKTKRAHPVMTRHSCQSIGIDCLCAKNMPAEEFCAGCPRTKHYHYYLHQLVYHTLY